mmetsp:Transcript_25626/g.40502  ORF Transcript_25626/g.40502 Transcript_25626/m.40502 type:complete len:331 (+) Transcript_25626:80-1072(+)
MQLAGANGRTIKGNMKDPSCLDNFGADDCITSLSDFLGVEADSIPKFSWREQLSASSHQKAGDTRNMETLCLAEKDSFSSCFSQDGAKEDDITSSGSTTIDAESPTADLSDSEEEWKCFREDWWDFPHSVLEKQVRYLENAQPFTRLLCMKNVKEAHRPESRSPWLEGRSDDIYEQMGLLNPSKSYVVFWLGFGTYSTVLFSSEVVDRVRLDSMLAADCLNQRLKLLLQPVRVSLPFPAKAAKDAETVGTFFGTKGSSIRRFRTRCGADVTSVQVDLFSKWLLKMAMTKVGLRENNCLEAVLVDWLPDSPAVLSAGRINSTQEFLNNFRA